MALIQLELTREQARWLLDKLDKQIDDDHWGHERQDPTDIRHCIDVRRELQSAARDSGMRLDHRHVGQCDS